MILNVNEVRIWKEVVVAYLTVLCWHSLGEEDEKLQNKSVWKEGSLPEISTGYLQNITSQCYHYTNLVILDSYHLTSRW
jgi:hypothetical protein